jgi:hypothetical protein
LGQVKQRRVDLQIKDPAAFGAHREDSAFETEVDKIMNNIPAQVIGVFGNADDGHGFGVEEIFHVRFTDWSGCFMVLWP